VPDRYVYSAYILVSTLLPFASESVSFMVLFRRGVGGRGVEGLQYKNDVGAHCTY